jgi:hypothetical protein
MYAIAVPRAKVIVLNPVIIASAVFGGVVAKVQAVLGESELRGGRSLAAVSSEYAGGRNSHYAATSHYRFASNSVPQQRPVVKAGCPNHPPVSIRAVTLWRLQPQPMVEAAHGS